MANTDTPKGFRPIGPLKHIGQYVAATTIYPGDAVTLHAGTSSTTVKKAQVTTGVAGAALVGIALNYATAGQSVKVADDPQQLFAGQCSASDVDDQVDLGLNASILATAGNSSYKCSRMEVDSSTIAVTAGLELKIVGIIERQDGKNEYGANVDVIFKINNHQLSGGTGTIAV